MRRGIPTAAALAAAALLMACGSEPESTPAACLEGDEGAFLEALESAPEQALLRGQVPISDCLVEDQAAGELNTVGSSAVAAATRLNARVRRDPGGEAPVRIGYLVGSIEEGASDTGGIHTDLVRRINTAARFTEGEQTLGAEFERTFGAGYAAARGQG